MPAPARTAGSGLDLVSRRGPPRFLNRTTEERCRLLRRASSALCTAGPEAGSERPWPKQEQAVLCSGETPNASGTDAQRQRDGWTPNANEEPPAAVSPPAPGRQGRGAAYLSEQSPSSSALPACGSQHQLRPGRRSGGGDAKNNSGERGAFPAPGVGAGTLRRPSWEGTDPQPCPPPPSAPVPPQPPSTPLPRGAPARALPRCSRGTRSNPDTQISSRLSPCLSPHWRLYFPSGKQQGETPECPPSTLISPPGMLPERTHSARAGGTETRASAARSFFTPSVHSEQISFEEKCLQDTGG